VRLRRKSKPPFPKIDRESGGPVPGSGPFDRKRTPDALRVAAPAGRRRYAVAEAGSDRSSRPPLPCGATLFRRLRRLAGAKAPVILLQRGPPSTSLRTSFGPLFHPKNSRFLAALGMTKKRPDAYCVPSLRDSGRGGCGFRGLPSPANGRERRCAAGWCCRRIGLTHERRTWYGALVRRIARCARASPAGGSGGGRDLFPALTCRAILGHP
jgi:hypothetical protein